MIQHMAVAKSSRKKTKRNTRRNLALLRKTRLLADKRARTARMEARLDRAGMRMRP